MKLHSFYPNTVYRFRTLNELNTLCMLRILLDSGVHVSCNSNVRSVSLITPRGTLRQFRMREDVNLLLNTKEMAELAVTSYQDMWLKLECAQV